MENVGGSQGEPHCRLVAGSGDRNRGVGGKAQFRCGQGGDQKALVVDGDDGVEGEPGRQGSDLLCGARRVGEVDDQGPVAHGVGQGLLRLGRDDHVDVEPAGCLEEVRGLVGSAGEQEQHARHARYHDCSRSITRLGGSYV